VEASIKNFQKWAILPVSTESQVRLLSYSNHSNKIDDTKSIIDDKQSTIKKNPKDNLHDLDYSNILKKENLSRLDILNKDISGRHSPIEQRKDIDTSLYHELLQDMPTTPLEVRLSIFGPH